MINSAGMSQNSLAIRSSTTGTADKVVDLNLNATMGMSSVFLELMRRRLANPDKEPSPVLRPVSPCLVNVSSLLALKGGYGASAYAASKAGVIAFTRALCLEAAEMFAKHQDGPGALPFRANVVVPGYIDTPMLGEMSAESRRKLEQQIPSRRFGTPDEVAHAVLFLVENEYANNCVLNVDGGLSAT